MSELTEQIGRFQVPDGAGIIDGGAPAMPGAEEFAKPAIVAPGEPALLPIGIAYYAPWEDPADATARHARGQVLALARAGLPVRLQSTSAAGKYMLEDEIDPAVLAEVGYLRNVSFTDTCLAIRHVVIGSARSLDWNICPSGARMAGFEAAKRVYENTIIYTPWERSTVDRAIVDVLNRCAAVWVPCSRNAQVMAEAGVERVRCVPYPFEPATSPACHIGGPRGSESVPSGRRFYTIGKWEPRKGYHALIGAFLLAFTPKERVSLFIKTSAWARWEGYPTPDESLAEWTADERVRASWSAERIAQRVRIVSARLPIGKLTDIHRENNIYVSASHGEGFDLPAFDAVCAGNGLVHVGYGGTEDYAPAGAVRVPWQLAPVHKGYGWEPEAQWAEYQLSDLVEALRLAAAPKRRVQPPDLYGRCGMETVGAEMRRLILGGEETLGLVDAGGFG